MSVKKATASKTRGKSKRRYRKAASKTHAGVIWPSPSRVAVTGRFTRKISAKSLSAIRDTSITLDRALKRLADK
jgi:hypothetical protein